MEASEVINIIEGAFDVVARPATSLRQFKLVDRSGLGEEISDSGWAEAGRQRVDAKWQDIPDSEIEYCDVVLAHMGPLEFRYYLPAYMRFAVNHYRLPLWESDILGQTVFCVYPSSKDARTREHVISQLSLLSEEQRLAVIEFLRFVAEHGEDVEKPDAQEALDRYWLKYS
jgi:hypothetical protein